MNILKLQMKDLPIGECFYFVSVQERKLIYLQIVETDMKSNM